MNDAPSVTIAGGGLAGLTAAFRLAERGYQVKLYEQQGLLGGNLGSRSAKDGVDLDVYPHMYLNWYHNFWSLLADVSLDRAELFAPVDAVKQLRRGEFPKFTALTEMYSPWYMFQNLFSGVGPIADMFVFGYASIDLLAERLNPTVHLRQMSVSAFLNARPYMSKRASEAFDSFITRVWAIPSYLASAHDFRTYLRYSLAAPSPAMWLLRGSALELLIAPIEAALRAAGVQIVTNMQVTGVSCAAGRVTEIGLQETELDQQSGTWVGKLGTSRTEPVDELVLAVTPLALSNLVRTGARPGAPASCRPRRGLRGSPGCRRSRYRSCTCISNVNGHRYRRSRSGCSVLSSAWRSPTFRRPGRERPTSAAGPCWPSPARIRPRSRVPVPTTTPRRCSPSWRST